MSVHDVADVRPLTDEYTALDDVVACEMMLHDAT